MTVKKLWYFPPLADGKQGRVFTKHYANLAFILPPNEFALLSFLIYQTKADNTFKWTTKLILAYSKAVSAGKDVYECSNPYLKSTPLKIKKHFTFLVENGLVLPVDGKEYIINPSLTYSKLYVKADFYKLWSNDYNLLNNTEIKQLVNNFISHVNSNIQRRKNK